MKILLAVDGSKFALDAVDFLVKYASWYRERPSVELLTVHSPVPNLVRFGLRISKAQLARWYGEQGAANLAKASAKLDRARIAHRSTVLVGPIAKTIVQHAARSKCNLILIGSRGMGAAGGLLATSVASKVLHLSKLPVLLAK